MGGGVFSFSQDFLKVGEALKAAEQGRLVHISFKKMRSLNNHNRLITNDVGKKKA